MHTYPFLEIGDKEAERAMKGRGKVTIIEKVPSTDRKEDRTIHNEWSQKAQRALKQARRLEQIIYRSEAMKEIEKDMGRGWV